MSVQRNAAAQAWLGAARALLDDPVSAEARAWLAAATGLPDGSFPPAPEGLVARPAPEPPALHHARRLQALAAVDSDPLEVAWHARWLAYALAPDDPANRPRVSVVIPVYNRRNQVVEAVRSVLEQDWPATEVVVVDDGSTDDPESMLAPWRARIVFRRLPQNGGVSVARNAALALATGELVHFLDSDNLLLPGALSRKVAAFAHVPDALLCFSGFQREVPFPHEGATPWPRMGRPTCPTQNPRVGPIIAYPFLTSTVMVARHLLRRAGNFETSLRRHEDRLLYQRLGLLEAKTVAIDAALMCWRRFGDSLFLLPDSGGAASEAALLFLNELLPLPRQWDLAALVFRQCFAADQWRIVNRTPSAGVLEQRDRLCAWLDGFAEGRHLPALSPRPLGAELLAQLERDGEGIEGPVATPVRAALRRLMTARPPGPADLALWRQSHNPPINRAAFLELFAALSADLRRGRPWVALGTLDQRPFRSLPHPRRRRWKRIAQAARLFGEGPARALARWRG